MIDLSRHIEYMLLENESVSVPSLGTFTTSYVSSTWIEEEETFLPPYRSVSYISENMDGEAFLRSLSVHYNISMEEANILCMEFSENILQELHDNGTSDIGSIGYFLQEEESEERIFVPCQAGVASPTLYGLYSVSAKPIKSKENPTQVQPAKTRKHWTSVTTDKENIIIKVNRHFANYAAAIAASVVLFVGITTPALNNFGHKSGGTEAEIFIPQTSAQRVVDETPEPVISQPTVEMKETESVKEDVTAIEAPLQQETSQTEQYAVVVASALSIKNAERYANELTERGYKASIYSTEKMNRVVITGLTSSEEAHAKVESMRQESNEFKSAWVLKMD